MQNANHSLYALHVVVYCIINVLKVYIKQWAVSKLFLLLSPNVAVRDRLRTKMERNILAEVNHPFVVKLHYGVHCACALSDIVQYIQYTSTSMT